MKTVTPPLFVEGILRQPSERECLAGFPGPGQTPRRVVPIEEPRRARGTLCAGAIWLVSLLFLSAVARGADTGPPAVSVKEGPAVATVGSVSIGAAAFERELNASRASTTAQKQAVLEKLIRFELFHAAALQSGFETRPEVAAAIRRLIVGAFVRERLEPRFDGLQVSEEEIKAFFAARQAEFTIPRAVRGAVIQIRIAPRASEEKRAELRARAETARAAALALPAGTASFGSVAVKYSEDQSTRYRGGDTGWLRADTRDYRWEPEVADAILALREPGEVGPVVAASSGYYLVKLMEIRESAPRELEEVRDRIAHQILSEKKEQVEKEFYAELTATIPVSVDERALAAVPLPEPRDSRPQAPPALPGP